jgi:hypothetical protein
MSSPYDTDPCFPAGDRAVLDDPAAVRGTRGSLPVRASRRPLPFDRAHAVPALEHSVQAQGTEGACSREELGARRADFPHRASTFGLRRNETLIGPWMGDLGRGKRILAVKPSTTCTDQLAALTTTIQLTMPRLLNRALEYPQRLFIAGHAVIGAVTSYHRAEPPMRSLRLLMPSLAQLGSHVTQLAEPLRTHGPSPHWTTPRPDSRFRGNARR